MSWDFGSVGSGAASGAAQGTSIMPGWGTAIGAVAGGLMGGFGSKSKGPNFGELQDIIDKRQAQITAFGNTLEAARNNVLTSYKNLQTNTMARFMPAFEASLGARGISASGGAFASGVGREAASLESNYDMMNANMTENNINTIGQMQSQLFGPQTDLTNRKMMFPYDQGQGRSAAQGQAFGQSIGPMAQMFGSALRSWMGSSGVPTETGNFSINPAGVGGGMGMLR